MALLFNGLLQAFGRCTMLIVLIQYWTLAAPYSTLWFPLRGFTAALRSGGPRTASLFPHCLMAHFRFLSPRTVSYATLPTWSHAASSLFPPFGAHHPHCPSIGNSMTFIVTARSLGEL